MDSHTWLIYQLNKKLALKVTPKMKSLKTDHNMMLIEETLK
jgi:hypothetical protein